MSIARLKSCIKKHGKAKTAVALGLRETNAISNWVSRKQIPLNHLEKVKNLNKLQFVEATFMPVTSND